MSCSNNDAETRARKADHNIARMEAIDAALQPYSVQLFDVELEAQYVISDNIDNQVLEKIVRPKLQKFITLGVEVFEIDRSHGVRVVKTTLDSLEVAMKRARRYLAAVNEKLTAAAHNP